MVAQQFIVPLADLEHGPKQVSWTIPRAWLQSALQDSGAEPRDDGTVEIELTRDGREVLVRGSAQVPLTMTCVRTLEPINVDVSPEIFLLLEQVPEPGPQARRLAQTHQPKGRHGSAKKPPTESQAKAWADAPVLASEDAARDFFRGDRIELDEFIREFIILELPMAPVRSDLHSEPEAASSPPSAGHQAPGEIDPRLAPLAAIAQRMRQKEHKE